MRSQQQRSPTRIRYWISQDVKRRPDARYWRWSVGKQAQICYYPTEAAFHSEQRCSHIANAADEHISGWVSSDVRQSAKNLNDPKRSAFLRPTLDCWMRFILRNVAIVDPDANLPVLHPTSCFKHPSGGRTGPAGITSFHAEVTADFTAHQQWSRAATGYRSWD